LIDIGYNGNKSKCRIAQNLIVGVNMLKDEILSYLDA